MSKINFVIITLLLLGIDLLSKYLIIVNLSYFESITIIDNFFYLTHLYNYGVSFSFGSQYPNLIKWSVTTVGLLFAGYFSYSVLKAVKPVSLIYGLTSSLLVAGALGNLIDRIITGHVTDFFHFKFAGYSFPIFNVADSFITLGIVFLIYLVFFGDENNPS